MIALHALLTDDSPVIHTVIRMGGVLWTCVNGNTARGSLANAVTC